MNNKKDKRTTDFVKLYVPELLKITGAGDEKTCLMMAQMEYWFGLKPDGFYKFMNVPEGDIPAYREGDSWTEEMGMSKSKIDNGLKPICTHYKSRTAYKNEADKFGGKFYCSYYHKPSHMTFYHRNHDEVNGALKSLSLEDKSNIFREKHSSAVVKEQNNISGYTDNDIPDVIDGQVVYTENTSENTSKITQEREEESSHSSNYAKVKNLFPSDFELTSEMKEWAAAKRPKVDVENSTEKFRVFYYGKFSADWLGAWQRWILNERNEKDAIKKSASQVRLEIYEGNKDRYADLSDNPTEVWQDLVEDCFPGAEERYSHLKGE